MIRALVFLAIFFVLGSGAGWILSNAGTAKIEYMGGQATIAMGPALIAALALLAGFLVLWHGLLWVLRSPGLLGRFWGNHRKHKGRKALSSGLIAVGAGDLRGALKHASDAARLLPNDPATPYLQAQAAQLAGERTTARHRFEEMLERPETQILGLRGLYMEADRLGSMDAKRHFALEANRLRPGLSWAAKAAFEVHVGERNWQQALYALEANRRNQLVPKEQARRLKAVLLCAKAMDLETNAPEEAKAAALEAHKLQPDFAPPALVAGRILVRLGQIRKAAKVLESSWQAAPHPQIARIYLDVRPGDAALDRLKRAQHLASLRANHPEGGLIVAEAALDARVWDVARAALSGVLRTNPTERACLMMADLEEGEHNDMGRVREWLARAVKAPQDATWVADAVTYDDWAPVSPATGALDAFVWMVPTSHNNQPVLEIDDTLLAARSLPLDEDKPAAKDVDRDVVGDDLVARSSPQSEASVLAMQAEAAEQGEATATADASLPPGHKNTAQAAI